MKNSFIASILVVFTFAFVNGIHHNASPQRNLLAEKRDLLKWTSHTTSRDYVRTKRQTMENIQEFQTYLRNVKQSCATAMNFQPMEITKSLLYEDNPTSKEKCLMECILKKSEIMDSNNKLSTQRIGRIADLISSHNALVVSIAVATADRCNKFINSPDPCEAAFQINKCIAHELKAHRIKINY